MPGASVFCQNTTTGTVSNNEGSFFLRLGNGGYDLVVSYTGYETKVLHISNGNPENNALVIELKEQDKALNEVVVAGSAEVADGWKQYGNFFLDNFIGNSPNAPQCTLQNPEVLKFYFYKKRNKLRIKSAENLVIINNALGYKIKYQLDSFVYYYASNLSTYTGYPLFEEMEGTPEQKAEWKKNRLSSYKGSRVHFMRSWYDSSLSKEGFDVELLDSTGSTGSLMNNPYDSAWYKSLDSGDVAINIHGKIRVTYKNHAPDRKYLEANKYPYSTPVQISALDVPDGFEIESNGYFYDQAEVTNIGYWAWKKIAELLPYDYVPEK